jgi:PAS domain-containing protein
MSGLNSGHESRRAETFSISARGLEDQNGSRFPAVVSVTALRDAQDAIIGYLLIGTDNTARKQAEEALLNAGALQRAIFNSANFSSIATDAKGVIQIFNVGAERMLGYTAAEVVIRGVTPQSMSDAVRNDRTDVTFQHKLIRKFRLHSYDLFVRQSLTSRLFFLFLVHEHGLRTAVQQIGGTTNR